MHYVPAQAHRILRGRNSLRRLHLPAAEMPVAGTVSPQLGRMGYAHLTTSRLSSIGSNEAERRESTPFGDFRAARAAAVASFERRYIEELSREHNGSVTQAAREAQQNRRALGRFLKKRQIDSTAL